MGSYVANDYVSVAVMGATGTGKTTFINLVSGSKLRVGDGLESCTAQVEVSVPFEVDGRLVELIDTPGFDDTSVSDADILNMIAAYLCDTYREGKQLAGIIYMHRISDFRVGGIAVKNFRMFRQLCGDHALQNLAIITNMWGEVSLERGYERERELVTNGKFFKSALDKGAEIRRHDNSIESGVEILRWIMSKQPVILGIQDEMVNQGKDLAETQAAEELQREIMEAAERQRAELAKYQEEAEAEARRIEEDRRMEMERVRMEALRRMEEERERELAEIHAQKLRMEEEAEEMEERHCREMESIREQIAHHNRPVSVRSHSSGGICRIM